MTCEYVIIWNNNRLKPFADVKEVKNKGYRNKFLILCK